jgi:hypothetical protein
LGAGGWAGAGGRAGGWIASAAERGAGGAAAGLRAGGAVSAAAFFTERIALAGAGVAAAGLEVPLPLIRARIRAASSSLIELLWLFTAMESFSAASSTSLLSRPRSRDSS